MCGPTPPAETELPEGWHTHSGTVCRCDDAPPPARLGLALADDDGCTVVVRGSRVLGPGPKMMGIAMEVGPAWNEYLEDLRLRSYLRRVR